ncbi:MAG TPA: hypothetical protein VE053_09615 [Allosphingosinicella sp.]|nr:hypothetical protein [Allosphingosinicella sp.]
MTDLYRAVKRLPETDLAGKGFQHDKLKEGFFRSVDEDRSVLFIVNGMWSHVELFSGVRFTGINRLLHTAAQRAGWAKERAAMFRLELVGMFLEKVGDFCAAKEDLGIYCPSDSIISSRAGLGSRVLEETARLSELTTIEASSSYVRERALFEPLGLYMLPAAAKLSNDDELWDWSVKHFAAEMTTEDRLQYVAFICELDKQ